MKKLKFIEEPGFVYDIIYMFVFNFNREYCLSKFNAQNPLDKDKTLQPISKELYPFFYLKDGEKCFIYEYYYESYIGLFDGDYGFSTLYKMLSQKESLKLNFIKYYFPKLSEEEQKYCCEHIETVCEKIRKSDYSDAIKCSMYSFFTETDNILKMLLEQLSYMQIWVKEKYESNESEINAFQLNFDLDLVKKYLNSIDINIKECGLYIVPCLIDSICFKLYQKNKINMLLIGIDYIQYIDYMLNEKNMLRLDLFGNVIAEKNRVDILDLILKKDEITIKDLEQELKLTGTNAYYHLNIMIKANIIKAKTVGKSVYYTINHQSFASVIDMLKRYK